MQREMKKTAEVAIFISDKTDTKVHYIMTTEAVQQEDIILVNIYAPNIGAPKICKANFDRHKGND